MIGQVVFILFTVVLFQFYLQYPFKGDYLTLVYSFAVLATIDTWLMYSMIRNFSSNERFIRLIFFSFFISYFLGFIVANPVNPLPYDSSLYLSLLIINQLGSFFSFSVILILMVLDIFVESHPIKYRLLGAACIYFNIGIVFGFVYQAVNALVPNAMGLNIPPDFNSYMHSVSYSFFVLGNIDSEYQVNGIIRSIGAVESILTNLYIVLLIGRLISK